MAGWKRVYSTNVNWTESNIKNQFRYVLKNIYKNY